ncbi:thermonuclease family protein [Cyanobium sp. ATX 6E8]|nr:thermonuclease family protein [Cyanobium sp. ATX 6E8]
MSLGWLDVQVGQAQPQGLSATVLSIGDGDTIRVRQAGRTITVRLACIDAPETAQSPYGQEARRYLQQRLPIGREVVLAVKTTDRYGRTVAEVFSGVNINLAMLEDGQAFAYRQYLGGCAAREYLEAEERANRAGLGIWQVPDGITRPWDFRRGRRSAAIPDGTTPGGRRYRCKEIGSYARAQELLRQGHTYLDSNGDGEACESLR